jgi:alkylated DNA repair protein alkB family protein 6
VEMELVADSTMDEGDDESHATNHHDSIASTATEGLHWSVSNKPSSEVATLLSADHRVGRIPSVYYFANFLPEAFIHLTLLPFLKDCPSLGFSPPASSPEEEYGQSLGKWKQLVHARRRVMMLDSTLQPFPDPIKLIIELMITAGVCRAQGVPPNHVLINEYHAGEGIMPHTDGPEYYSQTATISLGGSDVLFNFVPRLRTHDVGIKSQDPEMELRLEGNGSLVVFREDAYIEYCHTIAETQQETTSDLCCNAPAGIQLERGHRISLTFRTKRRRRTQR